MGKLLDRLRFVTSELGRNLFGAVHGVVVVGLVMVIGPVSVPCARHLAHPIADEIQELDGSASLLDRTDEALGRKEGTRPGVKGVEIFLAGEIGATGEEHVGRLHLVLNLVPLQGFVQTTWVQEADDGPNVDRLPNPWAVQSIQNAGQRGQARGLDQEPMRSSLEQAYERHVEHDPSAAADTATCDLADVNALSFPSPLRLHERCVQADQPVLVDQDGPPLPLGSLREEMIDGGRLADPERPRDQVYGDSGRVVGSHGLPQVPWLRV